LTTEGLAHRREKQDSRLRAVAEKKCRGLTRDGKACNSPVVGKSGYCVAHDPALADRAQMQRNAAARATKDANPDPGKHPSTGMSTDTPLRAIRCYCIGCVGSGDEVAECGGEWVLTTDAPCPVYPWRFGCRPETAAARGRDVACDGPRRDPLDAIREACLACCCGDEREVRLCPSNGTGNTTFCPLWPYRFGMTS